MTERRHEGRRFNYYFFLSWCHQFKSVTLFYLGLGKILYNIEQFGQYPLQVNGFNNLDECLEGAMVEKEIESLHSDQVVTSGREVTSSEHLKKKNRCAVKFDLPPRTSVCSVSCRDGLKSYLRS